MKTVPPTAEEIAAQCERIYNSGYFRGVKQRRLLVFLIDEAVAGRAEKLTERYIGDSLKDETFTFDEDSGRWGYPKTRANLAYIRGRLRKYYETQGYRDPVIIKLNSGSFAPVIARNPVASSVPELEPEIARLVLRAKTAIDTRTIRGALRAVRYGVRIPVSVHNSRQTANALFVPIAVAPIMPATLMAVRDVTDAGLAHLKRTGAAPWEGTFVEACAASCYRHTWSESLRLFELADTASQGESRYFWWHTALLASQGRIAEAIEILDGAVRHFSRTNIAVRTDLALLLVMNGQYREAEEQLASCLEFAAMDNPLLVFHLAVAQEAQDRLKEAAAPLIKLMQGQSLDLDSLSIDEALERRDSHTLLCGMYALAAGRLGATGAAAEMLGILLEWQVKRPAASHLDIALAAIGAQRFDDPVFWLRRAAFAQFDPMAMWFHCFPPLRHLRLHKGFKALLRELHLPAQRPR